jgi:hypothetical protein
MKLNEIFLTEGFPFKFQVPATIAEFARDIPGVEVKHFRHDLWVMSYRGKELELTVSEGGHILWAVWRQDSITDYDSIWNELQQKILQKYGNKAEIDVDEEEGGFPWDEDEVEEPEVHKL